MKITKGQLKQIIREEYSQLKRQGLIKESMDDRIFQRGANPPPMRSNPQMRNLVKQLCNAVYSQDQGMSHEEVVEANQTIAQLESQMDPSEFEIAMELAGMVTEYSEYAGPDESRELKKQMSAICAQLGIQLGDVI